MVRISGPRTATVMKGETVHIPFEFFNLDDVPVDLFIEAQLDDALRAVALIARRAGVSSPESAYAFLNVVALGPRERLTLSFDIGAWLYGPAGGHGWLLVRASVGGVVAGEAAVEVTVLPAAAAVPQRPTTGGIAEPRLPPSRPILS